MSPSITSLSTIGSHPCLSTLMAVLHSFPPSAKEATARKTSPLTETQACVTPSLDDYCRLSLQILLRYLQSICGYLLYSVSLFHYKPITIPHTLCPYFYLSSLKAKQWQRRGRPVICPCRFWGFSVSCFSLIILFIFELLRRA